MLVAREPDWPPRHAHDVRFVEDGQRLVWPLLAGTLPQAGPAAAAPVGEVLVDDQLSNSLWRGRRRGHRRA